MPTRTWRERAASSWSVTLRSVPGSAASPRSPATSPSTARGRGADPGPLRRAKMPPVEGLCYRRSTPEHFRNSRSGSKFLSARPPRRTASAAAADAHRAVAVYAFTLADSANYVAVRVAHALRAKPADRRRISEVLLLTQVHGVDDIGLNGPGSGAMARRTDRRSAQPVVDDRL